MGLVLKLLQTVKVYFLRHVYCAHFGISLYQIVGASCTVPYRESGTLTARVQLDHLPGLGQITWLIVYPKK